MTDQEFKELKAEYRHGQDDPYGGPRAGAIHALIDLVEELQQVAAARLDYFRPDYWERLPEIEK